LADLYGYNGKIVFIDLSNEKIDVKNLEKDNARDYIGGCGLNAKIIYDILKENDYEILKKDPLSGINPLIFSTGPLTASSRPSSGRYAVSAISPLTGIWGESTSGGQFPAALKHCGYDAIVFLGKAKEPVYIFINDSKIEIRNAKSLWTLNIYKTQELIKKEINDKRLRVACIGKAGKNLVKYACIINDDGRAAGRCGMGAVMGSKNLKALAVIGTTKINYFDKNKLRNLTNNAKREVRRAFSSAFFEQFGTLCYMDMGQAFGDTPAYYFTNTDFISSHITGRAFKEQFPVLNAYCYSCTIGCGRTTYIEENGKEIKIDGPEYETTAAFGPLLGISDMKPILKFNQICNEEGLDTISAGVSIAFLIYLAENKIGIDSIREILNDINLEELKWNNPVLVERLLLKIIKREDIGDLVAEGTRKMAKELKVDENLAAQVKGLEIPMHDPRAYIGQALSYMTSSTGANHNKCDYFNIDNDAVSFPSLRLKAKNRFEIKRKIKAVKVFQDLRAVDDSAITCNFVNLPFPMTIEIFNAITGFNYDKKSLLECGERINNLKRLINCKLGITREDDKLPEIVCRPLKSGSTKGIKLDLEESLKKYYEIRKWNWEDGMPKKEHLENIRIKF